MIDSRIWMLLYYLSFFNKFKDFYSFKGIKQGDYILILGASNILIRINAFSRQEKGIRIHHSVITLGAKHSYYYWDEFKLMTIKKYKSIEEYIDEYPEDMI